MRGLFASACSFLAVERPHPTPAHESIACTDSNTLPGLDTAATIGLGVAGAFLFAFANAGFNAHPTTPQSEAYAGGFLVGAVVAGLPFWTSASYGFYEVSRCRDARAERARPELRVCFDSVAEHETMCAPSTAACAEARDARVAIYGSAMVSACTQQP